jgi:hypothetical protein
MAAVVVLDGQDNTFISNCTWNGKSGMESISQCLDKKERSSMRCGTFPDSTFQPALTLSS